MSAHTEGRCACPLCENRRLVDRAALHALVLEAARLTGSHDLVERAEAAATEDLGEAFRLLCCSVMTLGIVLVGPMKTAAQLLAQGFGLSTTAPEHTQDAIEELAAEMLAASEQINVSHILRRPS